MAIPWQVLQLRRTQRITVLGAGSSFPARDAFVLDLISNTQQTLRSSPILPPARGELLKPVQSCLQPQHLAHETQNYCLPQNYTLFLLSGQYTQNLHTTSTLSNNKPRNQHNNNKQTTPNHQPTPNPHPLHQEQKERGSVQEKSKEAHNRDNEKHETSKEITPQTQAEERRSVKPRTRVSVQTCWVAGADAVTTFATMLYSALHHAARSTQHI